MYTMPRLSSLLLCTWHLHYTCDLGTEHALTSVAFFGNLQKTGLTKKVGEILVPNE